MRRLLPALIVVLALPARAEEARWGVAADLLAMSAPALPGLVLGGALDAARAVGGPFHLAARIGLGTTSDSNATWAIQQTHLLGLAGVGASHVMGRARLAIDVEGGALALFETARRHQFERLSSAQIPDRERTASTVAPFLALRGSIALEVWAGWKLRIDAGPDVAWVRVNGEVRRLGGVVSGVGVGRAL